MFKRALTALAVVFALSVASSPAWSQKDIRWGTPPVGTSGHKAMVILSDDPEQGDAAVSHLGTAYAGRHHHRQGLRHPRI